MNNKRGQFYILAAVIIVGIMVGIFVYQNSLKLQETTTYYNLDRELNLESGKVISYGIYTEQPVGEIIEDFTKTYVEAYSPKLENPQWLFIYGNSDELTVLAYNLEQTGQIGVNIGEEEVIYKSWEIKERKQNLDPKGKKKIKVKAFSYHYEFKLNPGENFYFGIGPEAVNE